MSYPLNDLGAATLVLSLALTGCAGKPAEAPASPTDSHRQLSPPARGHRLRIYTGRTAAIDSVEVQARVTGYLQKFNFQDGAEVKEGEVLCEIDPRPYQATFDANKALVAQNAASLELARLNNERFNSQ